MKLKDALNTMDFNTACETAQQVAADNDIAWDIEISTVFSAIACDNERAPGNIGTHRDDASATLLKWMQKYYSGKNGRASQRTSNPPGTVADPAIERVIQARLPVLSRDDLASITDAHRLAMSAENILGLLLEEYLSINIHSAGWYCAWGETVRSVDFVHRDGRLLQVKNRSNSENSSSSAIRHRTQIHKWYRIKANRIEYMWDGLNSICNVSHLSENNFIDFINRTLQDNPQCLAVEANNQWLRE